jgi:hypothetical protein
MGTLAGKKWLPRDVAQLLHDNGWADDHLVDMVATIGGESAYYEEAVGDPHPDGTIDMGLFQLNTIHAQSWSMDAAEFKAMAFDPSKAVKYARQLWMDAGKQGNPFQPWAAHENGSYKSFMKQAIVGNANRKCVVEGITPAVRYGK